MMAGVVRVRIQFLRPVVDHTLLGSAFCINGRKISELAELKCDRDTVVVQITT